MTDLRLAEIIRDLWGELEAADWAIVVMEGLAGLRPRRGRPPKVRMSVRRTGAKGGAATWAEAEALK